MTAPHVPPHDDVLGADEQPEGAPPWARRAVLAGLALVVAVVYGPDLLRNAQPVPAGSPGATPSAAASSAAGAPRSGPLTWPARGDLREDAAFIAQARGARFADARLLWAGPVGPDRVALFATPQDASDPAAIGLHAVRLPATGGQVSVDEVAWLGEGRRGTRELAAWLRPAQRTAGGGARMLLVLGPPQPFELQVSDRVAYRPDGSVRRPWRSVFTPDGTAVVEVTGPPGSPVVLRRTATISGPLFVNDGRAGGDPPRVEGLDAPGYRGPDRATVEPVVQDLQAYAGPHASYRIVWSGRLRDDMAAAIVQARLAAGGVLNVAVGEASASGVGGSGLSSVPWAEADTYPAVIEVYEPGRQGRRYLISPSGAGSIELLRRGEPYARLPLSDDGVAQLAPGFPGVPERPSADLRVRVRDDRDRVVADTSLQQLMDSDPLAVDPHVGAS